MAIGSKQINHPVNIVRSQTAVVKEDQLVKTLLGSSMAKLKKVMVGNQEYGNTKFPDDWLVLCYFKSRFVAKRAQIMAGYATGGGSAITLRMARMNTSNMFVLAKIFIKTRQIDKGDIRAILEPKGQGQNRAANSALYKFWSKELVLAAIKKQGSRAKAAKALGTTEEVVNKWADIEVERPL